MKRQRIVWIFFRIILSKDFPSNRKVFRIIIYRKGFRIVYQKVFWIVSRALVSRILPSDIKGGAFKHTRANNQMSTSFLTNCRHCLGLALNTGRRRRRGKMPLFNINSFIVLSVMQSNNWNKNTKFLFTSN